VFASAIPADAAENLVSGKAINSQNYKRENAAPDELVGTATIPQEVFSLIKSIVGAGVLSLPACIATFADSPSALVPSLALIVSIGIISGYCFSLIGRVCSYTSTSSYRDAWAATVSRNSSWLPATACTIDTFSAVLAYSMILADTTKSLLAASGVAVGRAASLFGVTGIVLLPLCLMRNLSSLAPFSLAGVIGMAYTAGAMLLRYIGRGYALPDGRFLSHVEPTLQPVFGAQGARAALHPSVFVLVCMLSTSYMAHFNAPRFYNELKNKSIERFNRVVGAGFGVSIALCSLVGSLGFLTFGKASNGFILNNYAPIDSIMSLSRVAVAISLIFSYPLAFVGVRDGVLDLMKVPDSRRTARFLNCLTVAILGFTTALALKVKDVSLVLALDGALLGNALIYVFPAMMFRQAVNAMGANAKPRLKKEVKAALSSAGLGIVVGLIGAYMAMKGVA